MKTARFWRGEQGGKVRCELCPHRCLVAEGRSGLCRVRGVRDGVLRTLGYGLVSSANLDPIEKKPLYHFMPGSSIFSVGGWGCNFSCAFCQNWSISQELREGGPVHTPEDIARAGSAGGSRGVAYTYNEPLVNIEFILDCLGPVHENGLANVLVTNGYVLPGPADGLLPRVDALNIDIKSMDEGFYRRECRGSLQPVLDFAVQAVRAGCHVEITNLVIPGLNDSEEDAAKLSRWIAGNLGRGTPLHLSAYRPMYKMETSPTPVRTLTRAREICLQALDYVYVGNVMTRDGCATRCPACGAELISRRGYSTEAAGIVNGACAGCGRRADVVTDLRDRPPRPARA